MLSGAKTLSVNIAYATGLVKVTCQYDIHLFKYTEEFAHTNFLYLLYLINQVLVDTLSLKFDNSWSSLILSRMEDLAHRFDYCKKIHFPLYVLRIEYELNKTWNMTLTI